MKIPAIIEVHQQIVSRNVLDKWHWNKRRKHSRAWESDIWKAFRLSTPKAKGKVKLKITSYRTRLLDHDNLVGGCKGILDAMKRLGIIIDDTPDLIEVEYEQMKVKGTDSRTVFEFY